MSDISPELKREWIVRALGIAGFTENLDFPGIYTQEHGMEKIVVNLTVGTSVYFIENKQKVLFDDEHDTLAKVSKMITEAEDGRMPSRTEADIIMNTGAKEGTPEQPDNAQTEAVTTAPETVPAVLEAPQALTPTVPSDLSIHTIKKYINDKATDEEAYVFLQLCKARGLNPFLKEAYLIKYDHVSPATMVVGKDAFMKRAELHSQYNGFEAGIITDKKEWKVGTFLNESEKLLGGWAKVYRKDREHPVVITVSMSEFNTGKSSWKKIPATMIRKVALVQGHREAFPSELSGMYDQSEMGVEVIT